MSFVSVSWQFSPDKVPCGYEPVRIDLVRHRTGIYYAVRQHGACMDRDGEWDIEPMPSSRTDEWLARFRFATWEDAAKAIERHCTPLGRFQVEATT